jgi:hypothetical protein
MFNWEGLLLKTVLACVESLYQHLTERYEENQQIYNAQLLMSALSDCGLTR